MGILERIADFMETADPLVLLAGMMGLLLITALAIFQQRWALTFLLLVTLTVDAAALPALGKGAALARFFMIFVMASYVIGLRRSPGGPWWMFLAYVGVGLLFTARSSEPVLSIQWGGLTLASCLAAASLVEYLTDKQKIVRLFCAFILCGALWSVLGFMGLLKLGVTTTAGMRFSGFTSSAGIFVQTGGILLPFVVWGALRSWNQVLRIACGVMAVVMVVVLLASAQRTGTFAGVIACLPLMARAKFQKLLATVLVIGASILVVVQFAKMNAAQTDFATRRFTSTSTSNRYEIWAQTLPILFDDPILGRGFGINKELIAKIGASVHNMYLQLWYDTGILGLLLFVLGGVWAGWQAFVLILRTKDTDLNEMARLMFGLLLAAAATGMFATGAASPSDFATMGYLFSIVITSRLVALHREGRSAIAIPGWSPAYTVWAPAYAGVDPRHSYWYWPKTDAPGGTPPARG